MARFVMVTSCQSPQLCQSPHLLCGTFPPMKFELHSSNDTIILYPHILGFDVSHKMSQVHAMAKFLSKNR